MTSPAGPCDPPSWRGDRIFVNKLAYDVKIPCTTWHLAEWGAPARGDIVIFFSPAGGKRLVKRVVGLPEDVVAMRDNRLIINGEPTGYEPLRAVPGDGSERLLTENLPHRPHSIQVSPIRRSQSSFGPVVVPEGQYLMLGDNRDNSADSRTFGFVNRELIVGRATAVVASVDPERHYLPRRDRFFLPLE